MKNWTLSPGRSSALVLLISLVSASGAHANSADRTGDVGIAAAAPSEDPGARVKEAAEDTEAADAVTKYLTKSKLSVYFERDSAELSREALSTISDNAERLRSRPQLTVTLVGFSDILGSSSFSVALAQQRTKTVTDALIQMGVAPRQIKPPAVGLEDPGVAPCMTEICKISYRRVEFRYPGAEGDSGHAGTSRSR